MLNVKLIVIVLVALFALFHGRPTTNMSMPGGFGNTRVATADEQAILEHVRTEVEARLAKELPVFHAVAFQTQVVAGVNYLMKVQIGDDEYVHVKIHKPLPHTQQEPFLMAMDVNNTADSPIVHIEN